MQAFSSYWKERLGVEVNKALQKVSADERKGKKEGSKIKKMNGKTDIS